jgi:acetyl esterase/lipase
MAKTSSMWTRAVAAAAVALGALGAAGASPAPVSAACASTAAVAQAAAPFCSQVYEAELTQDGTVYRTAEDYEGNQIDLALDVWEPVGDPVDQIRPAVLWMHGGYFEYGDRKNDQDVIEDFASRGFVVVSIDYRMQPVPPSQGLSIPLEQAVIDTRDDAIAAVQWIDDNAAALRVDPASIVASGYSAGAITALGLVHEAANAGDPPPVAAAVAFSGVDMYRTLPARADDRPVLMFNGEEDGIVPIGAAVNGCSQTVLAGSECDFIRLPERGHTSGSDSMRQQAVNWLAAHGISQLAGCEPFDIPTVDYTSTTTTASTTTTTAVTTTSTTAPVRSGTATPATPVSGSPTFTG